MINRLTLSNFKSVGERVYNFTQFDLLVGRNNSGKSTVLQALAIWQFCMDEFGRSARSGATGIQIVLPNFTALPVPEFNLLWKDRTDRQYPTFEGKKRQQYILIGIDVEWHIAADETKSFKVEIRYHSPQTIYAIPHGGWEKFKQCKDDPHLPRIAYVPPFSGLEPSEKWLDISPIRQQVGKAQPGSVLRNLLLRVCSPQELGQGSSAGKEKTPSADWVELALVVKRWFSVEIHQPRYESEKDVNITVEYRQKGKDYDIISGGSGFHQTLTLLAFFYGYKQSTMLLDEPDAHLHVNLQREILDYFKRKSIERGTQFLIATHAEEFVRGVDASQIISLLSWEPRRVSSAPEVIRAMAVVSNEDIARLMASPYILYIEGESDERILRAWAEQCNVQESMDRVCFKTMNGGSKVEMKKQAEEHFSALQQIIPGVKKLMLFDLDDTKSAFHPEPGNPGLAEWKRRNIENYLMVPDAWQRAALQEMRVGADDLFAEEMLKKISGFFSEQNLTLPQGKTWRNVNANVFAVVDGKSILFEYDDSLFHQLRQGSPSVQLPRERVAISMTAAEIHEDVHRFLATLCALVKLA